MPPRNRKRRGGKRKMRMPTALMLSEKKAYKGQFSMKVKLPGLPNVIASSGAGLINTVIGLDSNQVQGFATRFASTFDEYRVIGAAVHVTPVASVAGVTNFWFDEKAIAAPTAQDANERIVKRVRNTNANAKDSFVMRWHPVDFADLDYQPLATVYTPVYFKVYSDLANYATPAVAQTLFLINVWVTMEFRGLKAA